MTKEQFRTDSGEWGIVTAIALAGLGFVIGTPLLVAGATIPLWYTAVAVLTGPPASSLRVRRQFQGGAVADGGTLKQPAEEADDATDLGATREDTGRREQFDATAGSDADDARSGDPGERITVETTVTNTGEEPILDCRIADDVPAGVTVVDGTPTVGTTLDPGETATFQYTLELSRGEHTFGDARVRTSGLGGVVTETWKEPVSGDEQLRCYPDIDTAPLGGTANDYAGEVPTDEGGQGIEFHSVREYEPGDPVGSIDWRRYAKRRELATVEYRAERSTRSVCVLDARDNQFDVTPPSACTAANLSTHAARQTFETLVEEGHPTGIVRIRPLNIDVADPGTDEVTREQARKLLSYPIETLQGPYYTARHRDSVTLVPGLLPGEAQVFVFSSFVDDEPVELVEMLCARGYEVRVVSPDITEGDDTSMRLEALARRNRLDRARRVGATVVGWDRETRLAVLLRRVISR